jgi:hypothetical protein
MEWRCIANQDSLHTDLNMANIAIGISPSTGAYTAKVPVNSLAESGVPPEEGDKVQFSVEGTVQSVSGSNATLSIDSVNGEPVSEEASETPEEEQGEEGQAGATPGGAGGTPVAASGPGMGLGGGLPRPRKAAIPGLAALGNKLRRGARGPGAMQF